MQKIEQIYALYVDDDQAHIIYVGRAVCRFKRLKQHLAESVRGASKKCRGIRQLLEGGHTVNTLLLETVDLSLAPSDAEDTWITNIEGAGCDTLLNGKRGDRDRLFVEDATLCEWEPEAFGKGWERGLMGVPTGKWGKFINGILFVRTGRSKLYFVHPVYGKVDCLGFGWGTMIEKAIDFMNPKTDLHKKMVSDFKASM